MPVIDGIDRTAAEWESQIQMRGIAVKAAEQLVELSSTYVAKLPHLEVELILKEKQKPDDAHITALGIELTRLNTDAAILKATFRTESDVEYQKQLKNEYGELIYRVTVIRQELQLQKEIDNLTAKIARVRDKRACVTREQFLRERGMVNRDIHHTDYYMDLDDGTDGGGGTLHDGLKEDNGGANYAALGATDATLIEVNTATLDNNADDNYNGDYLYNVTRGLGALITDYVADDLGAEPACIITVGIAGQTAGDDFYIIRAIKTLNYWTTTLARTPGDNLFVRANTSEVITADVTFDEDGTNDEYIRVLGCDDGSSVGDPWGDGGNTKPIIDANNGAFQLYALQDRYWRLTRLDLRQSNDASGIVQITTSSFGWLLEDCDIHDNDPGGMGIRVNNAHGAKFTGCAFWSNGTYSVQISAAQGLFFSGCTFDGGVATTDYGILSTSGSFAVEDTTFGTTTLHDTASIFPASGAQSIRCRNCLFTDVLEFANMTNQEQLACVFTSEDHDQVSGAQKVFQFNGTVERQAGVQLDGEDTWNMLPVTLVSINWPLTLRKDPINGDWQVWLPAAESTITVTCRETAAWAADPTADEFLMEVSYLNHAVNATRTKAVSAQALNGVVEVDFTVTITPSQAGWAFITMKLGIFEDAPDAVSVSAVYTVA